MRTLKATSLAAAIAAVLHASLAGAANIDVDHAACTMANAITAANTDTATGGCPAGSGTDRLRLVADFNSGLPQNLPAITTNMTIVGVFAPPTRFGVEGGPAFVVGAPAVGGDFAPTVAFVSLDIEGQRSGGDGRGGGGGAPGMGGCLYIHAGTVTVDRSRFIICGASGGTASSGVGFSSAQGGGGGGGFAAPGGAIVLGNAGNAGSAGIPFGGGGGAGGATQPQRFAGGAGGGPNGGSAGLVGGNPTSGGPGGGGGGSAGSTSAFGGVVNAAAGAIYGGGGGGGGGEGTRGGNANAGGFGAGGGAGGNGTEGGGGDAGRGGFGGGSGTAGFGGPNGNGVPGGRFGGSASGNFSGSGAGLGGAIFVRTGQLQLTNTAFLNVIAVRGTTGNVLTTGQAKGGAIFALDSLVNGNGNDVGMPGALPVVSGCSNTFTGSVAQDAGVADSDNVDTFGVPRTLLLTPCDDVFRDGFEEP